MLKRLRVLGVVIAAVCLIVVSPGFAAAGPAVICDDPSSPGTCVLSTSIPGSLGGDPQSSDSGTEGGGIKPNDGSGSAADYVATNAADGAAEGESGAAGGAAPRALNSTECDWTTVSPSPGIGDPRWGGADPTTNTIIQNNCNGPTRYAVIANGTAVAGGGAAIPPPPPDPAVLAQQAIGQLQVPKPAIHLGPNPDKIAVNFDTWLWLDSAAPVSSTVALGGISVTATATLSSVDWSMGEPLTLDGGAIASVTCEGPGTAPTQNSDFNVPPPCGYMFKYRSLRERTNGVGQWPVSATATWSVTWAASSGQTGADSLSATSTTNVEVGEYRTTRGTGG